MSDDEKVIVGAPRRGIPLFLIETVYLPGSKAMLASICDHEVILAPSGQEAYATGEYGLICSDCVESYTILRGGSEEHTTIPGAVQEMENHLGTELAHEVIARATPEMERKIGMQLKIEETD